MGLLKIWARLGRQPYSAWATLAQLRLTRMRNAQPQSGERTLTSTTTASLPPPFFLSQEDELCYLTPAEGLRSELSPS